MPLLGQMHHERTDETGRTRIVGPQLPVIPIHSRSGFVPPIGSSLHSARAQLMRPAQSMPPRHTGFREYPAADAPYRYTRDPGGGGHTVPLSVGSLQHPPRRLDHLCRFNSNTLLRGTLQISPPPPTQAFRTIPTTSQGVMNPR